MLDGFYVPQDIAGIAEKLGKTSTPIYRLTRRPSMSG